MNQSDELPAGNFYLLQPSGTAPGATESFRLDLLINDQQQLFCPLQVKSEEELPIHQICIDTKLQEQPSTIKSSETQHKQLKKISNKPIISTKSSMKSRNKEKHTFNFDDDMGTKPDGGTSKGKNQRIQNYVHIPDSVAPPRAIAVLPEALRIRQHDILPRRMLPARTRFGPLQGLMRLTSTTESRNMVLQAAADKKPIFLLSRTEESVLYMDVLNKDICNWMGLLPLGSQNTANVWLYEEGGDIYGVTTSPIASRTPLALGYSSVYAEYHQLPPGQPVLDIHEVLQAGSKPWWCYECQRAMGSPALLENHMNTHHKVKKPIKRRQYRCKQCSRTFCRLFTLRRHVLQFCTKKAEEVNNYNQINTDLEQVNQEVLNSLSNVEDSSRVPSDESLQNYTNHLDFSINLFDTDRIPNLDISGGSRSEADFNPYSIGYKDEILLENDGKLCDSTVNSKHKDKNKKTDNRIFVSCPYCDQTLVKEKRRNHWRECSERRFECECGKIFRQKQKLALHIHTEHSFESEQKSTVSKPSDTPYKCEECGFGAKRRGILVNHYWRVHKRLASVPLERRVRHYPCVACPKIYCTADKRNRHVRIHHPDMKLIRAAPIEGERRTFEPAACTACPRQYATRAKLLQHMRERHPHLEAPRRHKKSAKQKKT